MNTKFPTLALSFGLLLFSAGAGVADGTYVYGDGSTSDYSAGVPVPAPMPVPLKEAQWYMHIGVGGSFVGSVDTDYVGNSFVPRSASEIPASVFGEVGFGYRFNRSYRVDFTSSFHDSYSLTKPELISVKSQSTNLINFYYDLGSRAAFTPYLGLGVGTTFISTTGNGGKNSDWQFSTAVMAGVSYDLNEYLALDAGYRLIYSPGSIEYANQTAAGVDNVRWTDFLTHQLRTGIRLKIY